MKKENQEHLPVMGVGPVCIAIMIAFTAAGIALVKFNMLTSGDVGGGVITVLFVIAGILCIAGGIILWYAAVFSAKIDITIKSNRLETGGVYASILYTWYPPNQITIYSAFLFICIGALLFCRNWYVLILPPLFWVYLTVFMKLTEEKWLSERFGEEYKAYSKRVNRFIPWKKIHN